MRLHNNGERNDECVETVPRKKPTDKADVRSLIDKQQLFSGRVMGLRREVNRIDTVFDHRTLA
jgi:hypothetical protein